MAVLHPLKLVIENFPEDKVEWFELDLFRQNEGQSETRKVPFTREVYIEQDDFMEEPAPKFFRLAPGREVRLMSGALVTCTGIEKDAAGNVVAVRCTMDPESLGGVAPDNRRVKSTLHWVSVSEGVEVQARLYNRLFTTEFPEETEGDEDFTANLNPESLETVTAIVEPWLLNAKPEDRFQFMRNAFFYVDPIDSSAGNPVFNRIVELRSSWKPANK
jgi:glutaminyl-tRNA synthetase